MNIAFLFFGSSIVPLVFLVLVNKGDVMKKIIATGFLSVALLLPAMQAHAGWGKWQKMSSKKNELC